MSRFYVVQKNDQNAIHAVCSTREGAQKWIDEFAPVYVQRGFFSDKTLTAESFEIKEEK